MVERGELGPRRRTFRSREEVSGVAEFQIKKKALGWNRGLFLFTSGNSRELSHQLAFRQRNYADGPARYRVILNGGSERTRFSSGHRQWF